MQNTKSPNKEEYDAVAGAGYETKFGLPEGSKKVASGYVLSNVQGRRRTGNDDLQVVLILMLLVAAVESLVVVGMYWSDAITKAKVAFTVQQFSIIMALTLAVAVAFAGLIAFASLRGKGVEYANVVQRARSAGLSESELLRSGVYNTDPWARQGGLRVALSTALGGVWAASLITYGVYWHNAAKVATAGAAAHWVAGAALIVAAAIGCAALLCLALGLGKEIQDRTEARESQAKVVDQPRQATPDKSGDGFNGTGKDTDGGQDASRVIVPADQVMPNTTLETAETTTAVRDSEQSLAV